MRHHSHIHPRCNRFATACLIAIILAGSLTQAALADSQIVEPLPPFSATDSLTSYSCGAWCAFGSDIAIYQEPNGLMLVDSACGSLQGTLGKPAAYINEYIMQGGAWAGFVTPDPSGESFWVGFTVDGNSDDRIYEVDLQGNWTQKATLMGNWDLEFHNGNAYVSANPGAQTFATTSKIYLLDTGPGDNHDVIADVGGYAAGLGIDSDGRIYYGTSNASQVNDKMYRFSTAQVAAAVGPDSISLAAAEVLFDIDGAPYDTDVDDADHLVFNCNKFEEKSSVAVWLEEDGGNGVGDLYQISAAVQSATWHATLDVQGDILTPNGCVLLNDYFHAGIAQISADLIPGDTNRDGAVDEIDATILAANWGISAGAEWRHGDFNDSGTVDHADAAIMADNWLQNTASILSASILSANSTSAVSVPEPGVFAMLLLGGVCVLAIARRKVVPA